MVAMVLVMVLVLVHSAVPAWVASVGHALTFLARQVIAQIVQSVFVPHPDAKEILTSVRIFSQQKNSTVALLLH